MSNNLSVIIPNYNHSNYIGEAIKSILAQSLRPLEFIIIDDGSTDNSVQIIKQFVRKDPLVRLICNEKNMGAIFSANLALSKITGEYFFGLAADDMALPGLLEKSVNILTKYPKAGFCCCDSKTIWEHTGEVIGGNRRLSNKTCYISPQELVRIMRKKIVYLSGFGSIIKLSALLETGLLPELKWNSDRMYSLIVALRYGICYIPEPLALKRIRLDSYFQKGSKNRKEHRKVIKNILDLLKTPAYKDVLPLFRRSAALASLGIPLLSGIIRHKEHRDYLSFNLVRLILRAEFKNIVYGVTPLFIKKVYRNIRDK